HVCLVWTLLCCESKTGGSFHQKTSNISDSKLSKPSISVALPSSKCQTIQTDNFRACCLSPQLWLALG
ncbi:hypothetical protein S83_035341, partial [Arachis hypogaea]